MAMIIILRIPNVEMAVLCRALVTGLRTYTVISYSSIYFYSVKRKPKEQKQCYKLEKTFLCQLT